MWHVSSALRTRVFLDVEMDYPATLIRFVATTEIATAMMTLEQAFRQFHMMMMTYVFQVSPGIFWKKAAWLTEVVRIADPMQLVDRTRKACDFRGWLSHIIKGQTWFYSSNYCIKNKHLLSTVRWQLLFKILPNGGPLSDFCTLSDARAQLSQLLVEFWTFVAW